MKKFYALIAAGMVFGCAYLSWAGETIYVPGANAANPLDSASYGGVEIGTSAFSAGFATGCIVSTGIGPNFAAICQGVIHGVYISSDNLNSFVDVYDSTTGAITPTDDKLLFRVYAGTAAVGASGGVNGTWTWLNYPVRFKNGLVFKPSVTTLNKVAVFFYRWRK